MDMGDNGIDDYKKMQANWRQFWSPCRRSDTVRCASPDGAHLWLHTKPLDAAIRQVPAPYCPGGRHGWRFWMKPKNTNKTHILPSSILTVDQRKKAKQFWDPKRTLYSRHRCNKLRTNVKPHYLSWRAQLHFEVSNIVNGQKLEKFSTLNKAQENLWAIYGPIGVKLLRAVLILSRRLQYIKKCIEMRHVQLNRQPLSGNHPIAFNFNSSLAFFDL